MYVFSLDLNTSTEVEFFTLPGNKFHRLGPFTEGTFSKPDRFGGSRNHQTVLCGRSKARSTLIGVDVNTASVM